VIDWLKYTKSGTFYRRGRRLSKAAISSVFRVIRTAAIRPTKNVFCHIQEKQGEAAWSTICFFHNREPSFLELPANELHERICVFVLLVEYRQHVAVFKSGTDLPAEFRKDYLRPAGNERVEAATARASATFEQVRLRNMSPSKYAMRTKTLEADDLRSVISPSGSSRYVPSNFRTREADVHYNATPGTGRIASRSGRVGYEELVDWATRVIDRLTDKGAVPSAFMRNFARPIDLSAMPPDLLPHSVVVDIAALTEELFGETPSLRLLRKEDQQWVPLGRAETLGLFGLLGEALEIRRVKGEWRILDPRTRRRIGAVRVGKTRIGIRITELAEAKDLFVEPIDAPGGAREALTRHVDRKNLFTVLFNNVDVVYMDGSLYRDPSLTEGGERLLGYLHSRSELTATSSEKGTFSPTHATFDADSVFGTVVNALSPNTEILVCDDLGDEWADFIGVNATAQPKTVTFYHAKHGAVSLSATAFHVSVAQAIKNLQHLRLTSDSVEAKRTKWDATYNNGGQQTQIHRMARGTFAQLQSRASEATKSPDTICRVQIVTDSLSKQAVADTLEAAKNGERLPAHFVHLYSLLMGFFSACAEVGAYPAVICQP
jgi:hypothetical protein